MSDSLIRSRTEIVEHWNQNGGREAALRVSTDALQEYPDKDEGREVLIWQQNRIMNLEAALLALLTDVEELSEGHSVNMARGRLVR